MPEAVSSGSEWTRTGTTWIFGFSLLSQDKKERKAGGKHHLCLTEPEPKPDQGHQAILLHARTKIYLQVNLLGSKS